MSTINLSLGELVAVSSLRSFSREDWNSLYSLSLTDDDPSSAAELAVTNNLNDASLLLCWVDCEGGLHNFSPLNDKSIQDGSVSNCHVENTFNGHAFVCFHRSDPIPACLSEVRNEV